MAASLISFLSIFYSINLNHVSRQNEQNTKRADRKPIAIAFVSEFEHVAAEIITHCFHSLPNVPTNFFGQGAQLFASQNSSLFGNGRLLSSKDILLDLARRCFWQLGYEVNFLRTFEVRQMITSVIAQLGFRRGRACF